MKSQSPNPYFNMSMIRNAEMFFGRTYLLRRFYAALANYQSISILGQRRMGKSSFLWCASLPEVQARFPYDLSHHIFVFLDLYDYLHKTSQDFFHRVSKEIIDQSAKVAHLTIQARTHESGEDEFSFVLDQVVEHGFFPVLLLDSFDKVTLNDHFDPDFFGFLRSQASRGRVSYITASINPLHKVCHPGIKGSPFFNIFSNHALEALSPAEALELITLPSQRVEMPFTEGEIALICKLAGRHPFFIHRVCHLLFEEKIQYGTCEISENTINELAYKELRHHFEAIWEQLAEPQQVLLRNEIRQRENPKREFPELSESALFSQFVASNYQSEMLHLSPEELEAALDKFNDSQALGDTKLRFMHTVFKRLEKNTAPSTTEKGMVIREVLREAFDRLKVAGTRSDSASEWRFYNILYYRYFKYHLKNEHIATRLGLGSDRTYYRERTKALEALRNALLEIERSNITSG